MANGFIQVPVDSTGKKLQTFENTVGANVVEAEAVVLVDNTGANACNVNGSGQLPVAVGNTPSVNQGTSPWLTRQNDGTNTETTLFDVDSSGVTHQFVQGISLRKSVSGGSVEGGTATNPLRVDPTGTTTQPVSGTVTANAGTGTFTVGGTVTVQQATATNLKVDLSGTAANATAIKVDGSAVTQPVSGTVTANQGGTWTVQPGNTANTTPWLVQDVGQATGGMSFFTASLTSTKQQVKATGGTIYGITAVNNGSALAYIQVFNKASANVTVGTTAPDYVVPVPAPSSGTAGAGIREEYAKGLSFGTGITVACTTTRTGSTTATCDVNVNFV